MKVIFAGNIRERSKPTDNDIAEVIYPFAAKCGLKTDEIEITITGADRTRFLNKPGIKLISAEKFSVLVLICTQSGKSVEAHLYIKNTLTLRSREGRYVFEEIVAKLDNSRVYVLPTAQPTKKARSASDDKHEKDSVGLVNSGEKLLGAVSEKVVTPDSIAISPDNPPEEDEQESLVPKSQTDSELGHSYYFHNMKNVQRAVIELVKMVGEDTAFIFNFKQFTTVIRNVGAPATIKPVPTIKTFISMGLIVRINEGPISARYNITQKALDFACYTDAELGKEEETQEKARRKSGRGKPRHAELETTEVSAPDGGMKATSGVSDGAQASQPIMIGGDPLDQIAILKAKVDGHKVTLRELEEARARRSALRGNQTDNTTKLRNISKRIEEIDIEMLRLQAERDELLLQFEELNRPSEETVDLERIIEDLERRIEDPSIQAAVKRLEDIRRMLS